MPAEWIVDAKFENKILNFTGFKHEVYECGVRDSNIPPGSTLKYAGYGSSGETNYDVTSLVLERSSIGNFNIGEVFYKMKFLTINNCNITNGDIKTVCNFQYLISIRIINNSNLTQITEDVLKSENLKSLVLSNNKITDIADGFLEKLRGSKLGLVDFRRNTKYDIMFDDKRDQSIEDFIQDLAVLKKKMPKAFTFLTKGNENLWESGELSDFVIKCEGREFNVHKSIIGANSLVFRNMFKHDVEETNTNFMTISDFSPDTVEDFLLFLYMCKLPEDEDDLLELFKISSKYDVVDLKDFCEREIVLNISDENATEVLTVANLFDNESLKKKSFAFICKMFNGVELNDDLMNDPEKIEKIVNARKQLEQLIKK